MENTRKEFFTKGEGIILKLLINMQADSAAFREVIIAKLFLDPNAKQSENAEFEAGYNKLRFEKQNEILAQIKNSFSENLGSIDDLIKEITKNE